MQAVFFVFFFLLTLFVFIWLCGKLISAFNALFGNTLKPENDVVDEGQQLENELEQLTPKFSIFVESIISYQRQTQTSLIDAAIQDLLAKIEKPKNQLKSILDKERDPKIIESHLSREEKNLGWIFSEATRGLTLKSEKFNMGKVGQEMISEAIHDWVNKATYQFVLVKKGEDFRFEEGDSPLVKLVKFVRRAFRWLERKLAFFLKPVQWGQAEKVRYIHVREVDFRSILQKNLGTRYQTSFEEGFRQLRQLNSKLKSVLLELGRVIRFNLESASGSLEESQTKILNDEGLASLQLAALGGFDRVKSKLDEFLLEKEQLLSLVEEDVRSNMKDVRAKIQSDCELADTIGEMAARFKDKILIQSQKNMGPLARKVKFIFYSFKKFLGSAKQRLDQAKVGLGLQTAHQKILIGELDDASVQFAQAKVPALYKRVFRFDSLGDEEFFVGRGKDMAQIDEAKSRWISGQPSSLAIHGPIGSGKTSLLQCAIHKLFKDVKVFSASLTKQVLSNEDLEKFLLNLFELDVPASGRDMVELAALVKSKIGPAVVTLEGGQHLFTRKIDGFEVLNEFFRFMNQTRADFFWVVGFSEMGWAYLDYTKNISRQFVFKISAQNMNRSNIEKVIMVRHDITGFGLKFLQEDLSADMKWRVNRIKNEKEVQEFLKEKYFDLLYELSNGNIFAALYYWLCSTEFKEDNKILIRFPDSINLDALRKLSRLQLATLNAVLQHGSLNALVHSQVFRTPQFQSENILSELESQKILTRFESNQYWPNPIIVPAAMEVLRERNYVYH